MSDAIESTELTVIPKSLPTILAADQTDIFGRLFAELKDFKPDISTRKGREEIASKALKVSVAKQDLLRLGKTLKEDHLRIQKAIVAEEKIVTEKFDALRNEIRAPLTEFENREKSRVAAHEAALAAIVEPPGYGATETIAELEARLDYLNNYPPRDWQEFTARAADALAVERDRAAGLLTAARKREAEAAELERLRAEEAERQRLAAIETQRLREEQIAAEAAANAKAEAEARAAQEAREAEERAQAQLRAAEAERVRQAEEAARREREAAEALERAEREKQEAIEAVERERLASLERQRAAEDRQRAAAQMAEAARVAAEKRAETERVAAVEAERRRAAEDAETKRVEDERRAADKAHRAAINNEAVKAIEIVLENPLFSIGTTKPTELLPGPLMARALVTAVAKGEIPHVRIVY